jgi:hypothetical protein
VRIPSFYHKLKEYFRNICNPFLIVISLYPSQFRSNFISAVQPNFYSMNLLMLGKSYMKLGNYQQAGIYLTKLKDFKAKTAEDEKVRICRIHLFLNESHSDVN